MKIIPAIDVIGGKCVRLTQGDYGRVKVYNDDPVEIAENFEDADLEYVHIVDLDGAKKGEVVNWRVLEKIRERTALRIDFGGGVKTDADVEDLLEMEIDRINIGSLAVREPQKFKRWIDQYGPDNFILSADVKHECIQINGWADQAPVSLYDLVEDYEPHGLKFVTCTDINTDGMLQGPNFSLYRKLKSRFPDLKIIASGGVSSMEDLEKLKYLEVYGVIIGKAIYEGKIKLEELTEFCHT
jgi:phosphoribosylformimino-5-aminoimidazole carboxamide ribotide isomerase